MPRNSFMEKNSRSVTYFFTGDLPLQVWATIVTKGVFQDLRPTGTEKLEFSWTRVLPNPSLRIAKWEVSLSH